MNLLELQSDFQDIMLNAECVGADWVKDSANQLSSRRRLDIYHNAYRVRLIDVLLDTFEHTFIYLGDDWFRDLAAEYVETHYSTQSNIGYYGQAFPDFLAVKFPDDKEISELALMDWSLRSAFDGCNSEVLTMDDLQQLAGSEETEIRLQPVPTFTMIRQYFNTLDIWQAINAEEQPPEASQLPAYQDIVIWRKGHSPHFRSLSRLESAALDCIRKMAVLDEIGEKLQQNFPDEDITTEFGLMLQRWLGDELLIRQSIN